MNMDLGGAPDMGIPAGMLQIGRWVLYDNEGMFVKAVASPQTYLGTAKVDFGVYEFSCAYINFWDTDYIGIAFDLKTGKPNSCIKNNASWKEANPYFKDLNCTQPVAFMFSAAGYPPSVLQVSGSFHYATASSPPVGMVYFWDKDKNTCTQSNAPIPGYAFYEFKPVPSWVLEIMEAPPYSMVLEY